MDYKGSPEKKKNGNVISTKKYWYYLGNAKTFAVSSSWIRCNPKENSDTFLGYWKNHVSFSTYTTLDAVKKNCKVGDVIQLCDNYVAKHSIICVQKYYKPNANGNLKPCLIFASHTNDYKDHDIERVYKDAGKAYKSLQFLVYHFA